MAELKRLEFVKGYATQGAGTADWVYQTARGFVPGFVEPYVKQVEETTLNVAAPYLTLAQDSAEKVLVAVDGQVWSVKHSLSSWAVWHLGADVPFSARRWTLLSPPSLGLLTMRTVYTRRT